MGSFLVLFRTGVRDRPRPAPCRGLQGEVDIEISRQLNAFAHRAFDSAYPCLGGIGRAQPRDGLRRPVDFCDLENVVLSIGQIGGLYLKMDIKITRDITERHIEVEHGMQRKQRAGRHQPLVWKVWAEPASFCVRGAGEVAGRRYR